MVASRVTPGLVVAHLIVISFLIAVTKAALGFQNASDALAFYGVYHREPANQFIHFFGVPGILHSFMVLCAHLPIPFLSQHPMVKSMLPNNHPFTYALVMALGYAFFYISIDPIGGTCYLPVLYFMYKSSMYWTALDQKKSGGVDWNGTGWLLAKAFAVHVFSWYIQIHVGHSMIEGAKPAVLQSIGGALTVAPLFAFYEGLWLVGINKQLQEQTFQLVDQYTRELCAAGSTMRVCESI